MNGKTTVTAILDRMAVGLSGLCLLHCLLSVLVVASISSVSAYFTAPIIHRAGLGIALLLGAAALGQGYAAHRALWPALVGGAGLVLMAIGLIVEHGLPEASATIAGVSLLALGHLLNSRAHR